MKINWTITSISIGIISGIAAQLSFQNWKITLPVVIVTFIIALFFNPKKRYFRAFSLVLALIAGLNKFFFEFSGNLFGIDFKIGSNATSTIVTVSLIALAGLCLVLDYLERKGKFEGTLFDFSTKNNKEVNINITGDGNKVTFNETDSKSNAMTIILGITLVVSLILSFLESNTEKTFYESIIDKEAIVQKYTSENQKEIDDLNKRLKDKERIEGFLDKEVLRMSEQISKLEKEKDRLQKEVENVIKSSRNSGLTKTSSKYQEVFKLFSEGNIKKALDELDDKKLGVKEQQTSENRKKEAQLRILKAQLLRVNNDYKEASENYIKAVNLYESYNNCFETADYFLFINDFKKAEHYYYICLGKVISKEKKAVILNNLGLIQSAQNSYAKAGKFYKEALSIQRELASVNPKMYLLDLGTTLNNLGVFYFDNNEHVKSLVYYKEALSLRRELASEDPQTYLPDVGITLNNLGTLENAQNEYVKALVYYKEALVIYKELASMNPKKYLFYLAGIFNNLGVVYSAENEKNMACGYYEKALATYRKLASINPQTYLPDVGMTLNNLGVLYGDQKKHEKELESFEEALLIYRKLASVYPQTYLSDVGLTLNNLGVLYKNERKYEKALESYEKALLIRRELAAVNPQAYIPDVGVTLINLAIFYQDSIYDKRLSIQYIDEAITILLPFQKIGYIQNYLKSAFQVLKDWDIDIEAYLKEKQKNTKEE